MATYPVLPISTNSRKILRDGRRVAFADSGKSYVSRLYSADRTDFEIIHNALTSTQLSTLTTFYGTNANIAFDFYWIPDATTYTNLRFGENALRVEPSSELPNAYDVLVKMIGP